MVLWRSRHELKREDVDPKAFVNPQLPHGNGQYTLSLLFVCCFFFIIYLFIYLYVYIYMF